jgi:hypothetical protein
MIDERDKAAVDRAVRSGPYALQFLLGSHEDITGRPVTDEMRAYHKEQVEDLRKRQQRDEAHSLPIDTSINTRSDYEWITKRGD